MKTISIGDIHGRPYWKDIDFSKYDRGIFVGDFTDSSNPRYESIEIKKNLEEIIELKKANPEKIVLILGNHDLPYFFTYSTSPCSRHDHGMYRTFHKMFMDNVDLFVPAYQIGSYLWTHAGVLKEWYDFVVEQELINPKIPIGKELERLFQTSEKQSLMVSSRRGGFDHVSGHFWADMSEHIHAGEMMPYHQIVGHSRTEKIRTWYGKKPRPERDRSITFIDCLDRQTAFYELEI